MSFTRSTTDLKVHQSLSDYPNVEDGLSAEELKKKFDAPAEQLQKDLNKLVDELENYGAENVGIRKLTEGDTSEPNVYAKLLYLLEQIQNAVLAQVPDGTITKAKMNEEYASTLAEKDGVLQTNLNAEQLNGKTSEVLLQEMSNLISSNYTTDVVAPQDKSNLVLECGFKPTFVIITGETIKYAGVYGAIVVGERATLHENDRNVHADVTLNDTGCNIYSYERFNINNTYRYIAFKG